MTDRLENGVRRGLLRDGFSWLALTQGPQLRPRENIFAMVPRSRGQTLAKLVGRVCLVSRQQPLHADKIPGLAYPPRLLTRIGRRGGGDQIVFLDMPQDKSGDP